MDYHLTRYVKLGRGDFIRANYDEYGNTPEIKKYSMSQSVQQIFVFEYLLFNGFILLQPKKQQSTIIISAVCCFGSCSGSKNEPDGQLYSTLVCDLICIRPSS